VSQRIEEKVRLYLRTQQCQFRLGQSTLQGLLSVLLVSITFLRANAREHRIPNSFSMSSTTPSIDPKDAVEP